MPSIPKTNHNSEWKKIFLREKSIFIRGFGSPNLVLYLLFFIVIFGGLSVWFELYQHGVGGSAIISLSTYTIALTSATFADVILSKSDSEEDETALNNKPIFLYLCLTLLCILGSCITFAEPRIARYSQGISTALAIFLWWQINIGNPVFKPRNIDPGNAAPNADHVTANNQIEDYDV